MNHFPLWFHSSTLRLTAFYLESTSTVMNDGLLGFSFPSAASLMLLIGECIFLGPLPSYNCIMIAYYQYDHTSPSISPLSRFSNTCSTLLTRSHCLSNASASHHFLYSVASLVASAGFLSSSLNHVSLELFFSAPKAHMTKTAGHPHEWLKPLQRDVTCQQMPEDAGKVGCADKSVTSW